MARVWAIWGWGGNTSMPGQPGTTPSLPRVPKSNIDSSEITWSWSPRSHSTGGLTGSSANALVSHHLPEKALLTPERPGATPGQLGELVVSPG